MKIIVIIFIIVSFVSALSALGYVTTDVVIEKRNKKRLANKEDKSNKNETEELPKQVIIESEPVILPENMPEPISIETGIEIIEVAWPESIAKNKIYRYDPNGEILRRGDTVLVPTFDALRHGEVLRTATVINGNYRVEPHEITRALKKIIKKVI